MQPEQIHIAVVFENGHVNVLTVVKTEYTSAGDVRYDYELTEDYIQSIIDKYEWSAKFGPIKSWHVVSYDEIDRANQDRTYRNAWTFDGKAFDHDMTKAREIQRVYLRKARLAEFCRLDNDYRIADEAGDEEAKTRIGAERQKYRDVTAHPRIDAATSVEELKALKLKELVPEAQGTNYMAKMKVNTALALLTSKGK